MPRSSAIDEKRLDTMVKIEENEENASNLLGKIQDILEANFDIDQVTGEPGENELRARTWCGLAIGKEDWEDITVSILGDKIIVGYFSSVVASIPNKDYEKHVQAIDEALGDANYDIDEDREGTGAEDQEEERDVTIGISSKEKEIAQAMLDDASLVNLVMAERDDIVGFFRKAFNALEESIKSRNS